MKVSLIVSGYKPDYVRLELESIKQQSKPPLEVIVSEDGESDEMLQMLNEARKVMPFEIKHVTQPKDGFRVSMVRNRGAALAKGDLLLFLDGDLLLHPKYIEDMAKAAQKGKCYIASRAYITEEKSKGLLTSLNIPNPFPFSWIEKNKMNNVRIPWIYTFLPPIKDPENKRGGYVCVLREDFVAINGYNEDFTGWGMEDSEFLVRLQHSGLEIRKIKFAALLKHVWHPFESRSMVSVNEEKLKKTLDTKLVYCTKGLDAHLNNRGK